MHERAAALIRDLNLVAHPEGGYFREVFRSRDSVTGAVGERSALTAIYFLLTENEHSRWHGVSSDELWHFCEGAPLELLIAEPAGLETSKIQIGPSAAGQAPFHVVEAGRWQAARSTGPYTLVTCTVAPGFDFADFRMLRDNDTEAARMLQLHPEFAGLI